MVITVPVYESLKSWSTIITKSISTMYLDPGILYKLTAPLKSNDKTFDNDAKGKKWGHCGTVFFGHFGGKDLS